MRQMNVSAVALAIALATAALSPAMAQSYVAAGTDYLTTGSGTAYTLGTQNVTINGTSYSVNFATSSTNPLVYFQGTALPNAGGADTEIERTMPALINAPGASNPVSAPLSILAVNLTQDTSLTPLFTIGGAQYALVAQLARVTTGETVPLPGSNPATTVTPDTGSITVYGNSDGTQQTFDSNFNVYIHIELVPAGADVTAYMAGTAISLGNYDLPLAQMGTTWSATAPANTPLAAQNNGFFPGQLKELEQYCGQNCTLSDAYEHLAGVGLTPAPTPPYNPPDPAPGPACPEPSTWAMMLAGFSALAYVGHRRKTQPAPVAA
jgi:hypothetical protein